MNPKLKEKILESLSAVLPITGIVLLLSIFLVPLGTGAIVMFFVGAVLLIVGMGMFQLGAEMAMSPLGEGIGVQISKSKRLIFIALISLLMGVSIIILYFSSAVIACFIASSAYRLIPLRSKFFRSARSVGKMEASERRGMKPERVAGEAVRLLGRKRMPGHAVAGLSNQMLVLLSRVLPWDTVLRLLAGLYG